ncbi:MAG: hypothetical protein K6A63_04710 [Acholeplasmatales bacterium]|nr:hypothetical protein [Acholeplasmatales bacterium]
MNNKIRIHFILEGNEEELLFEIIKELGVKECFDFSYENARGGGKIGPYFQARYESDMYDLVYCVYDVDYQYNDSDHMYRQIYDKLYRVLGSDIAVKRVSLCSNPNILLILLLGFDKVDNLKNISESKATNTNLINKYVPKIGNKKTYDASDWQLKLIKEQYLYVDGRYKKLLENGKDLNLNYTLKQIGSNIIPVLKALNDGDIEFFKIAIEEYNKC